jgi:hypothetical protein
MLYEQGKAYKEYINHKGLGFANINEITIAIPISIPQPVSPLQSARNSLL